MFLLLGDVTYQIFDNQPTLTDHNLYEYLLLNLLASYDLHRIYNNIYNNTSEINNYIYYHDSVVQQQLSKLSPYYYYYYCDIIVYSSGR